jgi:hypothetical protein
VDGLFASSVYNSASEPSAAAEIARIEGDGCEVVTRQVPDLPPAIASDEIPPQFPLTLADVFIGLGTAILYAENRF